MKFSKKIVNLLFLYCFFMVIASSSKNQTLDTLNLSLEVDTNENITPVIKSEEDKNIENKIEENDLSIQDKDTQDIVDDKEENNKEMFEEDIEIVIEREVTYSRSNMKIVSNITKDELESVFSNYKGASTMSHLAQAFVDAEKEYGVNAFAMAGIVALESGFATSRRAVEDNNLTGYEVYSDDSEGRLFSSQYESIMQTARHLSKNYLTEGGLYYNGLSVDAVQISYCPDKRNNWHNKVDILASGFLRMYNTIKK